MKTTISAKRTKTPGIVGTVVWTLLAALILVLNFRLSFGPDQDDWVVAVPFAIGQAVMAPLFLTGLFLISKRFRNLKSVAMIFFFASLMLTFSLIGDAAKDRRFDQPKDFLAQVVIEANMDLPSRLDDAIEVMKVEGRNNTLITTYKALTLVIEDTDIEGFRDIVSPQLIAMVCGSDQLREDLFSRDIALRYRYLDKNGDLLTQFDIDKSACE